jgi:serine/threonine-protein kinase RsbW
MARDAGVDEEDLFRITMAVHEATINAILHGNAYDPEKFIHALLVRTSDALVFKISDQGNGLNPAELPDPLAQKNLFRGTGRGIFLIRSLMDEVNFRQLEPGTEITLIKHLNPAKPAA